jgi:hypothetical protein
VSSIENAQYKASHGVSKSVTYDFHQELVTFSTVNHTVQLNWYIRVHVSSIATSSVEPQDAPNQLKNDGEPGVVISIIIKPFVLSEITSP